MAERTIDACLFDLDDVVVRTERYHFAAWKRLAEEEGWRLERDMGALLRGLPRMQCLDIILKHNGLDLPEKKRRALASRKNTYLVQSLCNLGPDDLVPGCIELIEKLKARGVKLGLFSLSQNAGVILKTLRLRGYFGVVLTGKDDRCAYYNPDIFLTCARLLGVKPERCVVFESVDAAAQFALDARMHVVGVGVSDMFATCTEVIPDLTGVDVDRLLATGQVAAR